MPDNRKVRVRRTKKFGRAVFALKPLRKGEVVAVFDGPVLDDSFGPKCSLESKFRRLEHWRKYYQVLLDAIERLASEGR